MNLRGFLTATVATLLITGCSDAVFSPEGVSGLYELVSVNGDPLPATATYVCIDVPITGTIDAGSITLNENSTYRMSLEIDAEVNGVPFSATVPDAGSFTLIEPSTMQFTSNDSGEFAGTMDGGRLTVIIEGESMVFER